MTISIVEAMRVNYGLDPDPDGINYGLACMATQAVISRDAISYYDRFTHIKNGGSDTKIRAFFDGVTLYSGLSSLSTEHMVALGLPLCREISAPARLLSFEAHEINTAVGGENKGDKSVRELMPCVAHKFVVVFDKESMGSYIKTLQSHYKETPFSLVINYMSHAVQIGFDGSKWLSVNHDHTACGSDAVFDNVLKNILSNRSLCDNCWCASVEIVQNKPDVSSAVIPHPIQVNTRKFASLPDVQRQECLRLALQCKHPEIVDAALKIFVDFRQGRDCSHEDLIELVAKKNFRGPGLVLALRHGDSEDVKTFMEVLADMLKDGTLSEEELARLSSAGLAGHSWLYPAMAEGNNEAVKVFMESLADMRNQGILSEKTFSKLVEANYNGTTGLFHAMLNGRFKTVRTFMEVLACMRKQGTLSEEVFLKLATAVGLGEEVDLEEEVGLESKLSGLAIALKNGDSEMVKAFMEVLAFMRKQGVLSEGTLIKLVAAEHLEGISEVLVMAMLRGHTEAVKTFMEVLAHMRREKTLSADAFVEIIAANVQGIEVLVVALKKGHIETLRAFKGVLVDMCNEGTLPETNFFKLLLELDFS